MCGLERPVRDSGQVAADLFEIGSARIWAANAAIVPLARVVAYPDRDMCRLQRPVRDSGQVAADLFEIGSVLHPGRKRGYRPLGVIARPG